MSARDSAGPAGPGNNGAGGLANGGVGGGMGGGNGGGGAGRNGGATSSTGGGGGGGIKGGGNNTGLTTGTNIYGNTAFGPAGGEAMGYATRDPFSLGQAGMAPTFGTYGNFRNPNGSAMFGGPLGGFGGGYNAMQGYQHAKDMWGRMQGQDYGPGAVQSGPMGPPPMQNTVMPTSLPFMNPSLPSIPGGMFADRFQGQNYLNQWNKPQGNPVGANYQNNATYHSPSAGGGMIGPPGTYADMKGRGGGGGGW